ncbi:MAG TPA: glycosyltransferase family 39 protein [Gaiellaceae bacterium]|jgi:hypothetical protein
MRSVVGLLVLDAGFLLAGAALVYGLRLADGVRGLIRYAGLALALGWATTGLLLTLAVTVGVPLSVALVVGTWIVLAAAGVLVRRREGGAPLRPVEPAGGLTVVATWAGRAAVATGVWFTAIRCWYPDGHLHPDVWNFWLPKAKIVYFFGGFSTKLGGFTSQTSPDYPPLHPLQTAVAFHFMGSADVLSLPLQSWILSCAFLGALVALLRLWVQPHVVWLGVGLLALMPAYVDLVGSGLADEPLAWLFALAGVTAALWLLDHDPRVLALAAIFAAAAVLTKNEGSMLVLAVALAVVIVTRKLKSALLFGSAAIVCVAVWRVWLRLNDVPHNFAYDYSKLVDVPYLFHRLHRLVYALAQLGRQLVSPSHWLLIPVALVVLAAFAPATRQLGTFVLVTLVLGVLGFAAIYWISPLALHEYVDNSVTRIVDSLMLFSAAALPLVAAEPARTRVTSGS